jgi:hypothetical protein
MPGLGVGIIEDVHVQPVGDPSPGGRHIKDLACGRRREPFPKVSGIPWDVVASAIEPDAEDESDDEEVAEEESRD